jgi:hypothetical protein
MGRQLRAGCREDGKIARAELPTTHERRLFPFQTLATSRDENLVFAGGGNLGELYASAALADT